MLNCYLFDKNQQQLVFGRMVRVRVLNNALKSMYNAEKRGKRQVMIRPSSKVIIKFLLVMQKHGLFLYNLYPFFIQVLIGSMVMRRC